MADHQRLEDDLRELSGHLYAPPATAPHDLAGAVRLRLERGPGVRPRRLAVGRMRGPLTLGRIAVAAVVLLVAVLAGTPVGRAAIVEVLRFAGIEVRLEPGPTPASAARPPAAGLLPGETRTDLADARARAAFPVYVPAALGQPDVVTVRDGDPPRVVSLIYRDDPVRLDEFGGQMVPYFRKFAAADDVEVVRVGGRPALWVRGPHAVVYVDREGVTRTESARLAGNTLIWQVDGVTVRLEGELTRARAVTIAESVSR